MSSSAFYFAYGSNLHPERLIARIVSAEFIAAATLPGRVLRFHKRGGDGSGKCDALYTGNPGDVLPGAVFRMATAEKPRLDEIEGAGYRVEHQEMAVAGAVRSVFLYVAEAEYIEPELRPFAWYKELVYRGAQYHDFEPQHLALIDRVPAVEAPDPERHSRNERILALMRGS